MGALDLGRTAISRKGLRERRANSGWSITEFCLLVGIGFSRQGG